jgi:carboxymethylenebutenolidase
MSGGLTVSLARGLPDRVKGVASIHGAWMVRESDDSPHVGLDALQAEVYLAWVDPDATAPPEHIPVFRDALEAAGVRYNLDVITTAVHGFAPAGERYDHAASELHWERVHSLFRRNL